MEPSEKSFLDLLKKHPSQDTIRSESTKQHGQAAAAAFGCGGSLLLSSASASIWQVVALRACGAVCLWRYVLAVLRARSMAAPLSEQLQRTITVTTMGTMTTTMTDSTASLCSHGWLHPHGLYGAAAAAATESMPAAAAATWDEGQRWQWQWCSGSGAAVVVVAMTHGAARWKA